MTASPITTTEGRNYERVFRQGGNIGVVFPAVVAKPDDGWYGRRLGCNAQRFGTRHEALRHVVGYCPACICDPVRCHFDDRYCELVNCGACLHGCPEDLCDMTEANRG